MKLGHALHLPIQQIRNIKTLSDIEKISDIVDKAHDVLAPDEWPTYHSVTLLAQELVKQHLKEGEYSIYEVIS